MDRHFYAAIKKLLLDFLGEEPLAADFGKCPILHPVAGRADDDDLRRFLHGAAYRLRNPARDLICLNERKAGASGSDAVAALHERSLKLYASLCFRLLGGSSAPYSPLNRGESREATSFCADSGENDQLGGGADGVK